MQVLLYNMWHISWKSFSHEIRSFKKDCRMLPIGHPGYCISVAVTVLFPPHKFMCVQSYDSRLGNKKVGTQVRASNGIPFIKKVIKILVAGLTPKHANIWRDKIIPTHIFLHSMQRTQKKWPHCCSSLIRLDVIKLDSMLTCGNGASHTRKFYCATHHRGLVLALYHLPRLWICGEQKAWLQWVLKRWAICITISVYKR
jgi:hypothetical protein